MKDSAGMSPTHPNKNAVLDSLRRPPFSLDDAGITWVQRTLASLSTDQKLRQLFNVALHGEDAADVTRIAELVIEAMALNGVTINYTGGEAGWPGDVPRFRLDVSKLSQLGWKVKHSSEAAIRMAIEQILVIS